MSDTKTKGRGVYIVRTDPPYFHCNSLGELQAPSDDNDFNKSNGNSNGNGSMNGNDNKTNDGVPNDGNTASNPLRGGGNSAPPICNPNHRTITSSSNYPSLTNPVPYDRALVLPCTQSGISTTSPTTATKTKAAPPFSAKEINATLNLHLGLPFNPMKVPAILTVCRWTSLVLGTVEGPLFRWWDRVPLRLRQKLTLLSWAIYLPLHRLLLSNRTSIHPDASYEYHAMTTVLYWGRLFPSTIARMRYSLSQLSALHGRSVYPKTVPRIRTAGGGEVKDREEVEGVGKNREWGESVAVSGVLGLVSEICYFGGSGCDGGGGVDAAGGKVMDPPEQQPTVTGYYLQHEEVPSRKVMLYLYGGAYLAGDAKGNLLLAEKIGQRCHYTDIFLPNYRLVPEYQFIDALHDVLTAYEYLVTIQNVHPRDIILFGISSGGGLIVRLLQSIAERVREGMDGVDPRMGIMPSGAVLMSPFVDYTEPKGSFVEYAAHDLVVNESVCEKGVPFFRTAGNLATRRAISPVHRSLASLPPLCILVSQHETVYDQVKALIDQAREAGVEVDVGMWRYMCHVWPVFTAFLPEARHALEFACGWVNDRCLSGAEKIE